MLHQPQPVAHEPAHLDKRHCVVAFGPHEDIAPVQAMIARWAEDFAYLQHLQQTAFAGDKRWQNQIDWMLDGLTDLRNEGHGLVDALGDRS